MPITPNSIITADHTGIAGLEEELVGIWRAILGNEGIGVHDRFLDAGGDSLAAMRCINRIRSTFGVEPTLELFLVDSVDIAEMAVWLASMRRGSDQPTLERTERGGPVSDDGGDHDMSLLNADYIKDVLHREAPWAGSHGSDHGKYLGAGLFYYSLAYMLRAQTCVCLGSAGAFVPRLMRQAQRDLGLPDARTILVDANIGHTAASAGVAESDSAGQRRVGGKKWGRPQWSEADSFFRTAFADVEIIVALTKDVAASWAGQIDYLHIDADYSHEGRLADFMDYAAHMAPNGVITFHDTDGSLPCCRALADIRAEGHEIVNFPDVGRGVALIRLRRDAAGVAARHGFVNHPHPKE